MKEDPNPNFQTQSVQASQDADPSNPYEIDNPNPSSQSSPPPIYSGVLPSFIIFHPNFYFIPL